MTIISLYRWIILVLFATIQYSIVYSTNTSNLIGFSSYLIHRDSLESPLNQTNYVANAIHRSRSRLSHFENLLKLSNNAATKNEDVYSTLVASGGEYFIEMSVGTPPVKQWAIADTGSDITWTQCLPCAKCYKQNQPFFNPKMSSSYQKLSCGSSACQAMTNEVLCPSNSSTCQYRLSYGDGATSYGELAFETYKLGNTPIPKMVYGCSHNNQGKFDVNTAGIFGLGGGFLSFVGQLRDLIGGKFSYCLGSRFGSRRSVKSKISFGFHAIVSGRGVVSTPVLAKRTDTFYYLILETVRIGQMRIPFEATAKSTEEYGTNVVEEGNIIIDTGTTLTYLPAPMYKKLEYILKSMIKAKPVQDPQRILGLCYQNSNNFRIPTITFHFADRAYMSLPMTSTIILHNNLLCLAIAPAKNLAVLGNLAQMNFMIGYDLMNGKISFKAADCSKI